VGAIADALGPDTGRIANVVRGTEAFLRPMTIHRSAFVRRMHALAQAGPSARATSLIVGLPGIL
jgi:hypothetical protein